MGEPMARREGSVQDLMAEVNDLELSKYGDSANGNGYTKDDAYAERCYGVMLGLLPDDGEPKAVLDLGCGTGRFYDFLRRRARGDVVYQGADLNQHALDLATAKFPGVPFSRQDILATGTGLGEFDYVVMNGLFNWRGPLSVEEMTDYWQRMIAAAYARSRKGIAFNAMSTVVDWERDDLFHLSFSTLAAYLRAELSRDFVIRHDYGAYEYTTYVYREPNGAA